MNRRLSHLILSTALSACSTVAPSEGAGDPTQEERPANPVDFIGRALETYPIVCLTEGGHQAREPHQFLRRLLGDRTILEAVDVIVVEFAAAQSQATLDEYIRGEDVPFSRLSKVWRDTGQSPRAPWDSPLYHELLKTIRAGNLALPKEQRVRVLAGDPSIHWEEIETGEEYGRSCIQRDQHAAALVMEQAFQQQKKVLVIYGGAHLPRAPMAEEEDPRHSITSRILKKHPDSVMAIGFLSPENLGVLDRTDELVRDTIYVTAQHFTGGINAERVFPEIYSRVTDPETGKQSWQRIPLYSGYLVRDLFDALIYIGPTDEWEYVPAAFDRERDAEYLKELNRRSLLRFGRPLNSGK